jgi:hypothetical protein
MLLVGQPPLAPAATGCRAGMHLLPVVLGCHATTYAAALQLLLLCSAFSALQAAFILAVHAMGVLGEATVAQLRELPADH